ncbi:MAG: hypothetical protein IPJ37_24690 [Bacteroidales bacterium]|nr:hypothetical protein [Bacteroidales bacterium]
MKRLTIILLVIYSVISFQNDLAGQNISGLDPLKCPSERIVLHLSQDSPFAGEILWFRVNCTSPVFPAVEISSVAFVELVSPENTSVIRKKILLDHGVGDGELNIPPDLHTGLYYVIAYTSWMKNFGESVFFRKAVAIVNPDQPYKLAAGSSDSARIQNINQTQDKYSSGLILKTDKPLYSSREKVTVTIKLADSDTKMISANVSLSVSRKEPQMVLAVSHTIQEPHSSITEDKLWLPDHKGIRLSGNLSDATGNGVSEARLIMSVPGPGTDLESSITNENGDFSFLLSPETGDKEIIITLPSSEMKLSLEEPFWNGFRKMPDDQILEISTKMIPHLRDKFIHIQLQNRFRNDFYEKIPSFISRNDTTAFTQCHIKHT